MLQDNKEPSGVNQFSNVPIEQIKRLMEGINFGSLIKSSQRWMIPTDPSRVMKSRTDVMKEKRLDESIRQFHPSTVEEVSFPAVAVFQN